VKTYRASYSGMVRYIADQMGLTKRQRPAVIQMLRHARDFILTAVMDNGQKVPFLGIGTFRRRWEDVSRRGEHLGIGSHRGSRWVLSFKASQTTRRFPTEEGDE